MDTFGATNSDTGKRLKGSKQKKMAVWVVCSAAWMSLVGAMQLLLLPVVVGIVADELSSSVDQMALVSSVAMTGFVLSSLAAVFAVRSFDWQRSACCCLVVLLVSCLLGSISASFELILITVGLMGGSSGYLYSQSLVMLSEMPDAERAFGYSVTAQVVGASFLYILVPWIASFMGLAGAYLVFACMAFVGLLLVRNLMHSGVEVMPVSIVAMLSNSRLVAALLGAFMFYLAIGSLWPYMERILIARGLSGVDAGIFLAITSGIGVVGSIAAGRMGSRFGRLFPILCAVMLLVLAEYLFLSDVSIALLAIAATVFVSMWNYGVVYQLAVISDIDASHRALSFAPAIQVGGMAVAPVIGLLFISAEDFSNLRTITWVAALVCGLAFVYAIKRPSAEFNE